MIENTKCECGHQNHIGTVLCESCGKPLMDIEGTAPLEMRYDGVARRSERTNPTFIDKVWSFFSSVRIAVLLIFITLCGSILGTILPQENTFLNIDPSVYYKETYGTFGYIYYLLGLTDTYNSWWFRLLIISIGASLIICSLDRVLPLYRALSKQKIKKHLTFLRGQKVVYSAEVQDSPSSGWIKELVPHLKKRGYRVYTEDSALLAEKHRFSRWGPYINHIGLIIFLLAILMRGLPGWYMDEYSGFLEGDLVKIPGTHYYLQNEQFTEEYYTEEELPPESRGKGKLLAKRYETKAVLYQCSASCEDPREAELKAVERHNITVNNPLEYKGLYAYQFDYKLTPQLRSVRVSLKDAGTGENYGQFLLEMEDPVDQYEAGPYTLKLNDYFTDFTFENGKPGTKSRDPNAPAFIFLITGPDLPESGEIYIYFPRDLDKQRFNQDKLNGAVAGKFDISVNSMEDDVEIANYTSYLNLRIDKALPYIFTGATIFLIGVVMGLYWQHRRIWLRIDEGNQLTLGAHTNKNWYGLRNDVAAALAKTGLKVDAKSLENGVNNQ